MRFSYYKRPLFIVLAVYILSIVFYSKPKDFAPPEEIIYGKNVRMTAVVDSYPAKVRTKNRVYLKVFKINGEKADFSLVAYFDYLKAGYKDRVSLKGRIRRIKSHPFPGVLDWKKYLTRRGVLGEMRNPEMEIEKKANFAFRTARKIREHTLDFFMKHVSTHPAVMAGVVMGEKRKLDRDLIKAFRDSGAMHLLVASGSNVGFVAFLSYFLCSMARLKKKYSYAVAISLCGIYTIAAGFDPPLKRAFIMFAFALTGFVLERESGVFQGLVMAAFLILLFEPRALFDAGFQMSFMATYAIAVGISLWGKKFSGPGWRKYLLAPAAVSFFAQVGLYPLIALYFHRVSLVSLFGNIIFVPFASLLMFGGFFAVGLESVPFLGEVSARLLSLLNGLFVFSVESASALPFAAVDVSPPGFIFVLFYYLAFLTLLHFPLIKNRANALIPAGLSLLLLLGQASPGGKAVKITAASHYWNGVFFVDYPGCGLMVFNPAVDEEKLSDAALELGHGKIKAVFITSPSPTGAGFEKLLKSKREIENVFVPFWQKIERKHLAAVEKSGSAPYMKKMWPGEKFNLCGAQISAAWPLNAWGTNRGFAGPSDKVDWKVSAAGFSVRTRDRGRCLEINCGGKKRKICAKEGKVKSFAFKIPEFLRGPGN